MEFIMTIKTKRGAYRRYNAIMAQCLRDAKGGLQYGLDWPTLRSTWPDRAAELTAIKSIFKSLPD
jgi:hypothetical protein